MGLGKGQARIIGGLFYQEVSGFKIRQVAPATSSDGNGTGRLDVAGHGVGWRLGAAYEIPQIAFRASLLYNSQVDLGNNHRHARPHRVEQHYGTRLRQPDDAADARTEGPVRHCQGLARFWLREVGRLERAADRQLLLAGDHGQPAVHYGGDGYLTSLDFLYRDGWTVTGGAAPSSAIR